MIASDRRSLWKNSTVRVIAATNKDLEKEAREGRFRQDLFFRLNVVQIALPALRERVEDIEPITVHFLKIYGAKRQCRLTETAVRALRSYSWPGNIRELENVVRRLLIFHDDDLIDESAVLAVLPKLEEGEHDGLVRLEELEKRHIMRTLAHLSGNKKAAAESLGVSLKTLYNKLHAYGWKPPS